MHFTLTETLMLTLILACTFMCACYMTFRKKGNTFVSAFDRAAIWGGGLFVIGSMVDAFAYVS